MAYKKEIVNYSDNKFPVLVNPPANDFVMPNISMFHPEVELHYVISGRCAYFIKDKLYYLYENNLLIIHSNEPHRYVQVDSSRIRKFTVMFLPRVFNYYITPYLGNFIKFVCQNSKNKSHLITFPPEIESELQIVFNSMYVNWNNIKAPYQKEFIIHKLFYLFMMIRKYHLYKNVNNVNVEQQKCLKECFDYIDKNYSEDIDLSHLADTVHLSPNYLSSLFTKLTGLSFKTHLNNKRISEAKKLIQKEPLRKIINIALEVGFNDLSNFNRKFKKLAGVAPSTHRKNCIYKSK